MDYVIRMSSPGLVSCRRMIYKAFSGFSYGVCQSQSPENQLIGPEANARYVNLKYQPTSYPSLLFPSSVHPL